jgi:putative tricarboxylic transport membrane protein
MSDTWNNLMQGFLTAGTPINLLWALVGCTIGTAIGCPVSARRRR